MTDPIIAPPPPRIGLFSRLRAYFFTGVVAAGPVGITIYVVWEFIAWIDELIRPLIPARYNPETYLPFAIPGFGLVIVLVGLTLVGFVTANVLGRSIMTLGERIVSRMPVVRSVYGALKQVFETVLAQSSRSFREVVLLEYPRRGIWALGFVTSDARGEIHRVTDDDVVGVFVPTSPNPTSGFLLYVPRKDLVQLDMTVEEGLKLVVSSGIITPSDSVKLLP